jgi:thioredoxin 1
MSSAPRKPSETAHLRLTQSNFRSTLHTEVETKWILVDFHAPWCRPCRAIAPKVKQLVDEHEDVTLASVDIDAEPDIAKHYDITTIPTFMIFEQGTTRSKHKPVVGADLEGVMKLIRKAKTLEKMKAKK